MEKVEEETRENDDEISEEDQERVKERLRALGYID